MTRVAIIVAVVLATLAGASVGALAWADSSAAGKLPAGARVAGVDVGGLTQAEARELANRRVSALIERPVSIELGDKTYTLSAQKAKVQVGLDSAIQRAFEAGRKGSFLARGWRKLSGEELKRDLPARITVDHAAIRAFVAGIEREQALEPADAKLNLTLTSVTVTAGKPGKRLAAREALIARLTRRLTTRTDDRTLHARVVDVDASVTADKVFDEQPIALTVSRDQKRLRVFKRGKLVTTYSVAVGSPQYPTPTGQFSVQTKQVNPVWSVPKSAWAGDLGGQVIPGGDPRNPLVARWIGFNGSVGFHGTASAGSIGTAASHGCVRMNPADVIDLFKRVEVGTPVLVA